MKSSGIMLEAGTLWPKTMASTQLALQSGKLQPIGTESTFVHDGGIAFLVRIVSSLTRKAEDKKKREEKDKKTKEITNPFLPYEADMFVADISDTHLCLLNKFNVIDHHLLIVTRRFEDQRYLLTIKDFEAIWACMAEFKGLAFYNGGEVAGASQRHKHLQMIPLPMADHGPPVPIDPLLGKACFDGMLGRLPGFDFEHRFVRLSPDLKGSLPRAAAEMFQLYRQMLEAAGLNSQGEPETSLQKDPYNLLLTREWMLLVPRSREFFGSISVNALGFAGALLVRDEEQMKALKDIGGMAVLRQTAVRK